MAADNEIGTIAKIEIAPETDTATIGKGAAVGAGIEEAGVEAEVMAAVIGMTAVTGRARGILVIGTAGTMIEIEIGNDETTAIGTEAEVTVEVAPQAATLLVAVATGAVIEVKGVTIETEREVEVENERKTETSVVVAVQVAARGEAQPAAVLGMTISTVQHPVVAA
jgi:hypothetical protein